MQDLNKKILLIYPPGKLFQRGEDRCQINLEDATTQSMRACNDLGYAAAVLLKKNYEVKIRDYQTEKCSYSDLESDVKEFAPDLILISTTNTTIYEDIELAKKIKNSFDVFVVFKGAIFYNPPREMLDILDLSPVDVIIGGEIDFIIDKVSDALLREQGSLKNIDNILYKKDNGIFVPTRFNIWEENLDNRPFPARELMNNSLYVRPDTDEPMATIQVARGCPSACIYCVTPQISGKKVRFRSPADILEELEECYYKYNIKNFFFRADTFTIDNDWVKELCNLIIESPLNRKIYFTANAKVKPLTKETLVLMKKAGCFILAIGFESGSEKTLKDIEKGVSVEDSRKVMKWAKEQKMPIFGMFMIGFPWETKEDIKATKKLIFELSPDFLEITLALPFYGTKLYEICKENNLLEKPIYGSDFFHASFSRTFTLTTEELLRFRKRILLKFYTRPSYILKKVFASINRPKVIFNYIKYGLRLLRVL